MAYPIIFYWKLFAILPTLSSLVEPQFVIMTTCQATSKDKVDILTTLFSVFIKEISVKFIPLAWIKLNIIFI